jgi:prepilin-type N-terminal cleavage/methylation domain-containing protein
MMKKNKAFTLIELLVVIAIIALLMGILMPALSRVKKEAQNITCRAHLKSWGLCFKLYTDDYEGKFNPGWGVGETALWMNALKSYYKNEDGMLRCPTAKIVVSNPQDWGTFKSWERTIATASGSSHTFVSSYGINSWTNYMTSDRGARRVEWFWKTANDAGGLQNNVPVFGDSTWHDGWPMEADYPPLDMDAFGTGDKGTSNEMQHYCIDRHFGKVNFTFMDWSVRAVGLKELWTLKWHREFNTKGPWTRAGGVQPSDWPQWMSTYSDY